MTKAEIIAEISTKTGLEKVDVQETVEAFFKVVKNARIEGENVYVRGFGSFVVKKRAEKTARNISKNTAIIITEHFVPSFKPAKVFVKKVKNGNKVKNNLNSLMINTKQIVVVVVVVVMIGALFAQPLRGLVDKQEENTTAAADDASSMYTLKSVSELA